MRGFSPVVVTLLAGALLYACEKSEALIWRSIGKAPFRSRCLRLTSIPRHFPSCPPPPLFLIVNQNRGETCLGRAGASLLRVGVAQRRTELRAKPRTDGLEPGTQGLSRQTKLAISVLIDLIGVSSYAVPGLAHAVRFHDRLIRDAQLSDVGWAPISAALILYLYGNGIFAGLAFVEEILPGLDFIPTATIAWFLTNSEVGQNVTNAASDKAESSSASDAWSPPSSSPTSTPFGNGKSNRNDKTKDRRVVDEDSIKSGVIDVEGD